MKDDPQRTEEFKRENRMAQMAKLRINWDAMGEMANIERSLAAGTIQDLMDEVEAWQNAMRKAERDIAQLRAERDAAIRERDTVRRTFCFIIASGNFNARDGNTAHRVGAEWVAELNGWDCFKEKR